MQRTAYHSWSPRSETRQLQTLRQRTQGGKGLKGSRKPAPPFVEKRRRQKFHGGPESVIGGRNSKRKRGLRGIQPQPHGAVNVLLSPKIRTILQECLESMEKGLELAVAERQPIIAEFFRQRIAVVKPMIRSLESLPSESRVTDGSCSAINPPWVGNQPGVRNEGHDLKSSMPPQ